METTLFACKFRNFTQPHYQTVISFSIVNTKNSRPVSELIPEWVIKVKVTNTEV